MRWYPWFVVIVSFLLNSPWSGAFDPSQWRVVFEDGFDRSEIGPDWNVAGNAQIVNGRLRYGDDGVHLAQITRPFADDVRIEFDAEAVPERLPCDLSASLASGGYLLAFGGMSNTGYQIIGGGQMERAVIHNPPKLIERGRIYRIAAMKEGKRLVLEVDGEVLLSATDEDPLGGQGYNQVGTITWNGMFVDNVRVLERKSSHPDTPRYVNALRGLPLRLDEERRLAFVGGKPDDTVRKAIDLFNAGQPGQAEAVFDTLRDPELRAAGVAYAVGHLYYQETPADCVRVGALLRDLAAAHPDDARLAEYGELGRRVADFHLLRGRGLPNGELAAKKVLMMGFAHNPFYDKARFYELRFARAHAMEGGGVGLDDAIAGFADLKRWYPDEPSLRELAGERIAWGVELIDDTSEAPAWARYLRELYARQCAVLHWWFTQRQLPDGQLGGGWGDDVEILRDWGPLAIISSGEPAIVDGIERMCHGIWDAELSEYGYSGYGDVEHASEPSADTLPTILLLRWGDPLWIERNMRSCKSIRDIYMGVDDNGYLRFKSAHFGGDRTGTGLMEGGDNTYCSRPAKHLQHLALWGNLEARRVYINWADGWLAQTMKGYHDKPAGFVPSTIFYPSGSIYPPGYQTHLAPDIHFHGACPGMGDMMQGVFMTAYWFTGDRRYLEPMYIYTMNTSYGPLIRDEQPPGSRLWGLGGHQGSGNIDFLTSFRWLSGDRTVDEYVLRFAKPVQRYFVDNDLDTFIRAIERSARSMRFNFRLMTKELLQTDRAGLPGTIDTFGAFTGGLHIWRESLLPTMAVTWDVPDPDFAALVVCAQRDRLRAWVYSFHDQPVRVGARIWWRLVPGIYWASHGAILPGEQGNLRYGWSEPESFTYRRPLDTYFFDVPPRTAYAVDLRLAHPLDLPETSPDLAVATRDIVVNGGGVVRVTVHNLGNAPVERTVVALAAKKDEQWQEPVRQQTGPLVAAAFDPVTRTLAFPAVPGATAYRVVMDPDNALDELYEGNNTAEWTVGSEGT